MKKFIITFITLLLLSGCTSNSFPKTNTSENGQEQGTITVNKTKEAWNYVDKAFEKTEKKWNSAIKGKSLNLHI